MKEDALLATDLDRTLLPNGAQPESTGVRALLFALAAERGIALAYVSGRRLALVEEAIAQYDLPRPRWVVGDVGSAIWADDEGAWRLSDSWSARLGAEWGGLSGPGLAALLADAPDLEPQEPEAQGPLKASFYAPLDVPASALRVRLAPRLEELGARCNVVHSVDEARGVGLVDVLPVGASKASALGFLVASAGLSARSVLFAGDSGNDLDALASPLPGVLVANATAEVRARALELAAERGTADALHVARGGLLGWNGNYAAGILEGWVHFHPEDRAVLEELARAREGGAA